MSRTSSPDCPGEQALRIDPTFPLAHFTHGSAALNLGQYDRAIADYSEALRLRPNGGADVYKFRGHAYYRKGDYDHTVADYSERLKLEPNDVGILLSRGDALRNKKELTRASAATVRRSGSHRIILAAGRGADSSALRRKTSKERLPISTRQSAAIPMKAASTSIAAPP